MCGDYRGLNQITKSDRYPMPMAEEIFDRLAESKVYSTLDLRQGFHQIPIREEDKPKTAFHGPDRLYEWNFMPFGLKNASATFQRVMDQVLQNIPCALCYIDDVVIHSKDGEQYVKNVAKALAALQEAGLTCHPGKCAFGVTTVVYLGWKKRAIGLEGEGGSHVTPLEPPQRPWQHVTMDFITCLLTGSSDNDAVLVVVDRFTKMTHFAPCRTTITAEETVRLFISIVVRLHVIPAAIISDRDPKFTSKFWQDAWARYGTHLQFSILIIPKRTVRQKGQTTQWNT
ncbi:hypothetical protein CLOM_g2210 [Closterium sp. NIES-68]|nr:hypothetical protein CLOM_g2210 [Closterium sp. NIES-68]